MARLTERMDALVHAQATLTHAQATLTQTQAEVVADLRKIQQENAARFARIERDIAGIFRVLNEHSLVLAEHTRMLERLPEEVRGRIGFKPPT